MDLEILLALGGLLWLSVCAVVVAMCAMAARGDGRDDPPPPTPHHATPRRHILASRSGSRQRGART